MRSLDIINQEHTVGAHNYHPLPVVFAKAKGSSVWDSEGKKYLDFLAAYSAVNQGHSHPKILQALIDQAQKCCLSSRAFYSDIFAVYAKFVTEYFGYEMVLPMNTGAEGVETAIKLARKWGYMKKGIPENKAIILSCSGNFHGRTIGVISMSTDPECRSSFGPFLPNVGAVCPSSGDIIRYNHAEDLEKVLQKHGKNVAGFLVEPIQGEAGVIVPDDGYLKKCFELCKQHNVLFIADEIQSGLGRSGKLLACDWEGVHPDVLILGKALSGGMYPVSAVLSNKEIMTCIRPGEHGSTYGGNPLGCAVAIAALEVLKDENLVEKSRILGEKFRDGVKKIQSPLIKCVRGRGLFNAIEIDPTKSDKTAWHVCLLLREYGILCKPTHEHIIRFSPPLVITEAELMEGVAFIEKALKDIVSMKVEDIPRVNL